VPKIRQIEGVKMSCFIRSKTWISNPFGDSTMMKLGLDPERVDSRFDSLQFDLSSTSFHA